MAHASAESAAGKGEAFLHSDTLDKVCVESTDLFARRGATCGSLVATGNTKMKVVSHCIQTWARLRFLSSIVKYTNPKNKMAREYVSEVLGLEGFPFTERSISSLLTDGSSVDYGLAVYWSSSSFSTHLVSPLTKEMVSEKNSGGGRLGGSNVNDIKIIVNK